MRWMNERISEWQKRRKEEQNLLTAQKTELKAFKTQII